MDQEESRDGEPQQTLIDELRQLIDEGKAYAEAELAWQKARATRAGQGIKIALAFGALALALAFFAFMALVLGLVLALSSLLTPLGATGAVVLGLLAMSALCLLVAARGWKRMTRDIGNDGGTDE